MRWEVGGSTQAILHTLGRLGGDLNLDLRRIPSTAHGAAQHATRKRGYLLYWYKDAIEGKKDQQFSEKTKTCCCCSGVAAPGGMRARLSKLLSCSTNMV